MSCNNQKELALSSFLCVINVRSVITLNFFCHQAQKAPYTFFVKCNKCNKSVIKV